MDNTLEQIACDYHYNTEHYDRLVCTGMSDHNTAMPRTSEENHKIQVNARQELVHAIHTGRELNYKEEDVRKAISEYAIIFNYEREKEYRNRYHPLLVNPL
jgi:hypothetical protein